MREAVFDLTDDSDDDFRCEIQVPSASPASARDSVHLVVSLRILWFSAPVRETQHGSLSSRVCRYRLQRMRNRHLGLRGEDRARKKARSKEERPDSAGASKQRRPAPHFAGACSFSFLSCLVPPFLVWRLQHSCQGNFGGPCGQPSPLHSPLALIRSCKAWRRIMHSQTANDGSGGVVWHKLQAPRCLFTFSKTRQTPCSWAATSTSKLIRPASGIELGRCRRCCTRHNARLALSIWALVSLRKACSLVTLIQDPVKLMTVLVL
jgi:hypothetical protein